MLETVFHIAVYDDGQGDFSEAGSWRNLTGCRASRDSPNATLASLTGKLPATLQLHLAGF